MCLCAENASRCLVGFSVGVTHRSPLAMYQSGKKRKKEKEKSRSLLVNKLFLAFVFIKDSQGHRSETSAVYPSIYVCFASSRNLRCCLCWQSAARSSRLLKSQSYFCIHLFFFKFNPNGIYIFSVIQTIRLLSTEVFSVLTFKLPTNKNARRKAAYTDTGLTYTLQRFWACVARNFWSYIPPDPPLFLWLFFFFFFLPCKQSASSQMPCFRCGCIGNKKRKEDKEKKLSKALKPKRTLNIVFLCQLFAFSLLSFCPVNYQI